MTNFNWLFSVKRKNLIFEHLDWNFYINQAYNGLRDWRLSAKYGNIQPIFTHRCVFATKFQHLLSERLTSLGIMGAPRVPPLNPSETIVLSEHYRL